MNEEPIYSQVEINAMLTCPKWAVEVDWDRGEESWPQVRSTPGERAIKLDVFPDDAGSRMSFCVELRHNVRAGSFSISLHAKIKPNAAQAICRYDVHGNAHPNESYCDGPDEIAEGVPHRHVYNEQSLKKLKQWHACAEPVDLGEIRNVKDLRDQLKRSFLEFVNIKLCDRHVYHDLMKFGTEELADEEGGEA